MIWRIPAKTFFLGEYAAMLGGSAIIVNTTPCFEMSLIAEHRLEGIHTDSPAGRWWTSHSMPSHGLRWYDPYNGQGGLGASSAQFLGAYLAGCRILGMRATEQALLDAYLECAWRGEGLKPSGYDVLAQSQHLCVYINRQQKRIENFHWPFEDIGFLLVHSGQKLATHYHLQTLKLPIGIEVLSPIVDQAKLAFEQKDSNSLVEAVNAYQQQLVRMQLIAKSSQEQIDLFRQDETVLAAKGCGAMGADVLLLILPAARLISHRKRCLDSGWTVLASSADLYQGKALIKNNSSKALEIIV